MMSLEENKALVQAYFDNVWNQVNDEPGYRYGVKEGSVIDWLTGLRQLGALPMSA
jgi:hypothetical protein